MNSQPLKKISEWISIRQPTKGMWVGPAALPSPGERSPGLGKVKREGLKEGVVSEPVS